MADHGVSYTMHGAEFSTKYPRNYQSLNGFTKVLKSGLLIIIFLFVTKIICRSSECSNTPSHDWWISIQ